MSGSNVPGNAKVRKELGDEYPSRRFERDELVRYTEICRERTVQALDAETARTLAGPSGFSWITGPRAEVHLNNLRHISHHTGQLSAFLRRVNVSTKWVKEVRA